MSSVTELERNRAKEAYKYVIDGKKILELNEIYNKNNKNNEYYKDDKYKSYVKKIPMMILNNGLGATFAFIYSKQKKYDNKKNKKAGERENPKNAYDLIYYQVDNWLQKSYIKKIKTDKNIPDTYLMNWIVNLNSSEYRIVTNEVLALFNWLKRFADGMIEGEDNA
jgi:CRISPR-associated protein Cmr5